MTREAYPRGVIFDLQGTLLVGGTGSHIIPRTDLRAGLQMLHEAEINLGVVTTHREHDAQRLLAIVEVVDLFNPEYILGRDSRRHKEVTEQVRERRSGLSGKLLHLGSLVPVTVMKEVKIEQKPSAEPIEYLLGKWGVQASETIYVGDDPVDDYGMAQAAGTKFSYIPPLGVRNYSLIDLIHTSILD